MGIQLTDNKEKLSLAQKMMKGDPGGYYIPEVAENGDLKWTPSEEGMYEIPGSNIRGPQGIKGDKGDIGLTGAQGIQGPKGDKGDTGSKGESGVWVGEAEPTEEYDVWISPAGEASTSLATVEYVDNAIANIEHPTPDLSGYYTKEEVDSKIPDTSNFATKDEIPDVSNFATKDEIPTVPDTSSFITMADVEDKGYQTAEQVNQLISAALPASVEGVKF